MEEIDEAVPRSPQPRAEVLPAPAVEDDAVDGSDMDDDEEVKPFPNDPDLPGCAHYKRKCQLVCPDPKCDNVYTCRICHDDAEPSHQLDRYGVKEVVCLTCQLRQPVSNCCIKCSTTFGKFFCKICNLFMDVYRDTFHCDGCGLCRVGPKDNFFHCDKCQMCMPIALGNGKHRCIEKSSRRDCPVCLEDIHTSRSSSHVPPCGHLLHQQCFNQLIRKSLYTCPICNQSMVAMKPIWKYLDEQIAAAPPLPAEFTNEVNILCRDCHERSSVMFHFVGLKCGHCGGYNTCIESGSPLNPEAFNRIADQMRATDGEVDEEEGEEEEGLSDSEFESAEEDLGDGEVNNSNEVNPSGNFVSQGTQYDTDIDMDQPSDTPGSIPPPPPRSSTPDDGTPSQPPQ